VRAETVRDTGPRARPFERRYDATADEAPAQDLTIAASQGGLRGLAERAARAHGGLTVARPAPTENIDDFAHRLDVVLKREALRNGVDLEEIDR
jgi:hypothetical protein